MAFNSLYNVYSTFYIYNHGFAHVYMDLDLFEPILYLIFIYWKLFYRGNLQKNKKRIEHYLMKWFWRLLFSFTKGDNLYISRDKDLVDRKCMNHPLHNYYIGSSHGQLAWSLWLRDRPCKLQSVEEGENSIPSMVCKRVSKFSGRQLYILKYIFSLI